MRSDPESLSERLAAFKEAQAAIIDKLSTRTDAAESSVAVLESQVEDIKAHSVERFIAQREAVQLALAAAKDTTAIAQSTADKAVAKAEAAADKQYLESQIAGLRDSFNTQIESRREALNAALAAAKDALNAAITASDRAIAKAEESNNKRFESVNEFRKTLSDQTASFITRNEYSVQHVTLVERVASLEKTRSEDFGKGRGVASLGTFIAGAVAVAAGGVAIYVALAVGRAAGAS